MIDQQQLANLRAKAEAATPGPWVRYHHRHGVSVHRADSDFYWVGSGNNEATADYIAAANPSTVIAMIDEIERLRERNAKLERVREAALKLGPGPGEACYCCEAQAWVEFDAALDAAKEATDG